MIHRVVVEVREGEVTMVEHSDDVDLTVIDWDSDDWSYDRIDNLIHQVLDSDLDGPIQFRLIGRLVAKFDEVYGDAVETQAEKRYER